MKKLLLIILFLFSAAYPQRIYKSIIFDVDSVSTEIDCGRGVTLVGIVIPEDHTDTLTFQASLDGTTYAGIYVSGDSLYTLAFTDTFAVAVNFRDTPVYGWPYYKILLATIPADSFNYDVYLEKVK